jgi:hypothetical protein
MSLRWTILAGVAFLLLGASASAQERMLTADAEAGFRRVMRAVESGKAGADIREANVSIRRTSARVELVLANGDHSAFLLHPAGSPGALQSRYFSLSPEPGASMDHAMVLQSLLDSSFEADPFQTPPKAGEDGFAVHDSPPVREAWEEGGVRGALLAIIKRSLQPVPRRIGYPAIALNLLALLFCLVLVCMGESKAPRN